MSRHTWFSCLDQHPADESRKEDTGLLSWRLFTFHSVLTQLQDFSKKPSHRKTTQARMHAYESLYTHTFTHAHTLTLRKKKKVYIHTSSEGPGVPARHNMQTNHSRGERSWKDTVNSCSLPLFPTHTGSLSLWISFLLRELCSPRFNSRIDSTIQKETRSDYPPD